MSRRNSLTLLNASANGLNDAGFIITMMNEVDADLQRNTNYWINVAKSTMARNCATALTGELNSMSKMLDDLPEALIVECAERLGASRVPVEAIQAAWKCSMVGSSYGCLNNDNGKRLFIAYRLRELGCFEVGCQFPSDSRTWCVFHFFDIYYDTKNLTDEEYAEFMNSRSKYQQEEASVAATKLWKLIDSQPVNVVAARATGFRKGKRP